jgi:hypothetical protein
VWGPAPADGSFETITPEEVTQAKQDAKVRRTAAAAAAVTVAALAMAPFSPSHMHLPRLGDLIMDVLPVLDTVCCCCN